MDRDSRSARAASAVALALPLLVVGAVPARAAFPRRDGLLVVQPSDGRGLFLVGVRGAHPRRFCTVGVAPYLLGNASPGARGFLRSGPGDG
jgi:hypothetical protein